MPVAVTFCLDRAGAARVTALCRVLERRGISDYNARLGYKPHLTLLRGAALHLAVAVPVLEGVVADLRPFPLRLEAPSFFHGDRSVLWLAPDVNPALRHFQERLYQALAPLLEEPVHSKPEDWIPHVTIAGDLRADDAEAAEDELAACFVPFAAELDRIEVVRFPPVRVEWRAAIPVARRTRLT